MSKLADAILGNPLFGITLSVLAWWIGQGIAKKAGSPIANPLVIAMILLLLLVQFTPLTLVQYDRGGEIISMLLPVATAALAISVYRRIRTLQKHLLPILAGCLVGSLCSMGSVVLLCRLFGIDQTIEASMLPKSVTTPIAMEVAASRGGIPAVAVAAVLITGIVGAVCAPLLIRLFRVREPVAQGVGIGVCSHALGTSKALEIGEAQGAMSSISIGVAGMATVVLSLFY